MLKTFLPKRKPFANRSFEFALIQCEGAPSEMAFRILGSGPGDLSTFSTEIL